MSSEWYQGFIFRLLLPAAEFFSSFRNWIHRYRLWREHLSSEEALIVVVDFFNSVFFWSGWYQRWHQYGHEFYILGSTCFPWIIDGPTNAAAIKPLIIVAVPRCLRNGWLRLGVITVSGPWNFEFRNFYYSSGEHGSNVSCWAGRVLLPQVLVNAGHQEGCANWTTGYFHDYERWNQFEGAYSLVVWWWWCP